MTGLSKLGVCKNASGHFYLSLSISYIFCSEFMCPFILYKWVSFLVMGGACFFSCIIDERHKSIRLFVIDRQAGYIFIALLSSRSRQDANKISVGLFLFTSSVPDLKGSLLQNSLISHHSCTYIHQLNFLRESKQGKERQTDF